MRNGRLLIYFFVKIIYFIEKDIEIKKDLLICLRIDC